VNVRGVSRRAWTRLTSREVRIFLGVGGTGYVVDVATFNLLLSTPSLAAREPVIARVLAVGVAMLVTYLGNRFWTWRDLGSDDIARQVTLFVVFNVMGMGFSVVTLFISHHLLGLTSRLADNISANVIGLLLGTVFRYWSYSRYVFTHPDSQAPNGHPVPTAADTSGEGRG
jgi:putative flippase GtrA